MARKIGEGLRYQSLTNLRSNSKWGQNLPMSNLNFHISTFWKNVIKASSVHKKSKYQPRKFGFKEVKREQKLARN